MLIFYIGLLGLMTGSFINAVVWRIKEGKSFISGRSMCPRCRHILSVSDLVPVLSWLLLRGKCRYCQKQISVQYPLVELVTAGLFVLSYLKLMPVTGSTWAGFVFWLYILGSLIALTIYDLRWMLLPDKIVLPAIGAVAGYLALQMVLGEPWAVARGPVLAAFGAGGGFYLLAAVSKGRWMGGGDIKLVFLMGLVLGIQKTLVALFLASNVAALVGLALLLAKKLKSHYLPFGPFLALGTVVAMLYGREIINFYLELSGLNYYLM